MDTIKKVNPPLKKAPEQVDYLGLQAMAIKSGKKYIPKTLHFEVALQLLIQCRYPITKRAHLHKLIEKFSIPCKKIDGEIIFDRKEFMKWFICDGRLVATPQQESVVWYVDAHFRSKR